jgi:hypothetical protein
MFLLLQLHSQWASQEDLPSFPYLQVVLVQVVLVHLGLLFAPFLQLVHWSQLHPQVVEGWTVVVVAGTKK